MITRNLKSPLLLTPVFILTFILVSVARNQKHLLKIASETNFYRQYLPRSLSFNNLPDYVLKYEQPLNLPIHCIPYSTMRGKIPICIHENPREYITRSIRTTGFWEKAHEDGIQKILYENPDYGLLDVGANLGMYSLLAANLKRPVLAVEAMDVNIEKFHQSVVINRFEEYITLVTRPLSDKHETLKFIVSRNNLGRSRLIKNKAPTMEGELRYENKTALMLNDLIDLMPCKKAVMIIDVEGCEGKVIRGGLKFFDAIDITHVFMEWVVLSHKERKYLIDFLETRGYQVYKSPDFTTRLNSSIYEKWGNNVYWKK